MNFQPVQEKERIVTLDVLRGFSLLGIILVNIMAFYLPLPHILDLPNWFTSIQDILTYQYIEMYVKGSFYPLFSMLFGYGLAMQFVKAKSLEKPFYTFASKRLIVIFTIGIIHAFCIWWGDILMSYAFCGAFLLLFLRYTTKKLFTYAFALYFSFTGFILLVLMLSGQMHTEVDYGSVDLMAIKEAITAYGTGTWLDAFHQRLEEVKIQYSPLMWFSSLFTILPYMLLGAAAGKANLIERARQLWKGWLIVAVLFTAIGIFLKNAPILFERTAVLDFAQYYLGGPILAIGYSACVICLCLSAKFLKVVSPVAKLGRMSLTAYLTQSIILSIIFYNFGFGLYGKIDVIQGIYIAIVIYIAQLVVAELWFIRFKQGPVEALVKKIIYFKKVV